MSGSITHARAARMGSLSVVSSLVLRDLACARGATAGRVCVKSEPAPGKSIKTLVSNGRTHAAIWPLSRLCHNAQEFWLLVLLFLAFGTHRLTTSTVLGVESRDLARKHQKYHESGPARPATGGAQNGDDFVVIKRKMARTGGRRALGSARHSQANSSPATATSDFTASTVKLPQASAISL